MFPEKLQTEEEKHKISEEKFLKMKTCYGQIRDEHIQLLRKVILISKVLAGIYLYLIYLRLD